MGVWICKRGNSPSPARNHPEGRAKWKTSLPSKRLCQDTRISLIFQVKTLICTTLKQHHKPLCTNKLFHFQRVWPQTGKHPPKTQPRRVPGGKAAAGYSSAAPMELLHITRGLHCPSQLQVPSSSFSLTNPNEMAPKKCLFCWDTKYQEEKLNSLGFALPL